MRWVVLVGCFLFPHFAWAAPPPKVSPAKDAKNSKSPSVRKKGPLSLRAMASHPKGQPRDARPLSKQDRDMLRHFALVRDMELLRSMAMLKDLGLLRKMPTKRAKMICSVGRDGKKHCVAAPTTPSQNKSKEKR
ncbi:MAG: hypothetical protein H6728_11670 [Myxococcales bacterium]|nr:hypothetical protein [Myxococcales bacterium]